MDDPFRKDITSHQWQEGYGQNGGGKNCIQCTLSSILQICLLLEAGYLSCIMHVRDFDVSITLFSYVAIICLILIESLSSCVCWTVWYWNLALCIMGCMNFASFLGSIEGWCVVAKFYQVLFYVVFMLLVMSIVWWWKVVLDWCYVACDEHGDGKK